MFSPPRFSTLFSDSDCESIITSATTIVSNISSTATRENPLEPPPAKDSTMDKEYPVEKILDFRHDEKGVAWYMVQWGCPCEGVEAEGSIRESSWTEAENIDCPDLVEEFHNRRQKRQEMPKNSKKRSGKERKLNGNKVISLKKIKTEMISSDEQDSGSEMFLCAELNCGKRFSTARSLRSHKACHSRTVGLDSSRRPNRKARTLPARGNMLTIKNTLHDNDSDVNDNNETLVSPATPSSGEPVAGCSQQSPATDYVPIEVQSTPLLLKAEVELDVKPAALPGSEAKMLETWVDSNKRLYEFVIELKKSKEELKQRLENEKKLKNESISKYEARIKELENQLSSQAETTEARVQALEMDSNAKNVQIAELERKLKTLRNTIKYIGHLTQQEEQSES